MEFRMETCILSLILCANTPFVLCCAVLYTAELTPQETMRRLRSGDDQSIRLIAEFFDAYGTVLQSTLRTRGERYERELLNRLLIAGIALFGGEEHFSTLLQSTRLFSKTTQPLRRFVRCPPPRHHTHKHSHIPSFVFLFA